MKKQVLALLLVAPITFTGCSDERSKVRGEFLAGCVQGGASKVLCSCVLDKLESVYSTDEMRQMGNAHAPSQAFLKHSIEFAMACSAG